MTSTVFGTLYDAAQSGDEEGFEKQIVPGGTYDTVVDAARPYTGGKSPMIFLTLQILNGPLAGRKSDVNVTFSSSPNARPYFVRKTKGFLAYPDAMAALQQASSLDNETGIALIAESWVDKQVKAEIGVNGADQGQYAGQNNLERTEAIGAAPAAPQQAAPAAAPVAAPAAAPAAATPFVGGPAPVPNGQSAPAPVVTVPF